MEYGFTVYKFKMFFDNNLLDAQERYVVAKNEEEAIAKFKAYVDDLEPNGYAKPSSYWHYPEIEIQNAI